MTSLAPGLCHSLTLTVTEALTVPRVSPEFPGFADMPLVFATAFMVGLVEAACIEALKGRLEPGQHTVGTRVDLSHSAATPVGMAVTAAVKLVVVDGRRLVFEVACTDAAGPIGEGTHERAVITVSRFLERVQAKALAR
jgi:fluoroacetyl-CoA thioesterase